MDESLARSFARAALANARKRYALVDFKAVRLGAVPGNRVGQTRWLARTQASINPIRFGRARRHFGKPFRYSTPAFTCLRDAAAEVCWQGLAIGQYRVEADRKGAQSSLPLYLFVQEHALIRIAQRADVVGLDAMLAFMAPALPWVLAHENAAREGGSARVWLPVTGSGRSGLLICRQDPDPESPRGDATLLMAVTFVERGRLSPFKAKLLAALEQAQKAAAPPFPFFQQEADLERHGAAIVALADVYSDIARFAWDFEDNLSTLSRSA